MCKALVGFQFGNPRDNGKRDPMAKEKLINGEKLTKIFVSVKMLKSDHHPY
jgi:hypothetical protein